MVAKEERNMDSATRLGDIRRHLVLLFVLVLLLFDWPLVTIPFSEGLMAAFFYLFAVWAALIVVLFVASHRLAARLPPESPPR